MKVLYTADPVRFKRMTTEEQRESFLINDLFKIDKSPTVRLSHLQVPVNKDR